MRQILLLLLFSFSMLPAARGQDRPNILVVIADDMGVDALGSYGVGTSLAATPNLDALADRGIRFENVWASPLCAPTRAAMLSGLYGNKTGVLAVPGELELSETTLFEAVEDITGNEYSDAVFGKWHLSRSRDPGNPNDQGVDHFVGFNSGGLADYFSWERSEDGMAALSTDYFTSEITSDAIDWVAQQRSPWLLWLAHAAPHSPFHLPPDSLYTRTQTGGNLNRYLAMIESVDHEVGRLLDSITPDELENTLIIFIGDNGTPNQVLQTYPAGRGKGTLYQGGVKVPMIVAGAGVTRFNETEDALVNVVDVFATISELVGGDNHGSVNNSFSFLSLLSDEAAPSRPYNLSEIGTSTLEGVAIRNDRYKLIALADGTEEFYDLIDDPFEVSELISIGLSDGQAAVLTELRAEALAQVSGWSCNDGILNGGEQVGDCDTSTTVAEDVLPSSSWLDQNVPNPFRGTTEVRYSVPEGAGAVSVQVYDLQGRRVRTLSDGPRAGGSGVVVWDGSDDAGRRLPAGVYLYRLGAGSTVQSRTMVLVN